LSSIVFEMHNNVAFLLSCSHLFSHITAVHIILIACGIRCFQMPLVQKWNISVTQLCSFNFHPAVSDINVLQTLCPCSLVSEHWRCSALNGLCTWTKLPQLFPITGLFCVWELHHEEWLADASGRNILCFYIENGECTNICWGHIK